MKSILDFGARGDGTDDSQAIQLALDSEKEIIFPAGYRFNARNLLIGSNTTIYAYGSRIEGFNTGPTNWILATRPGAENVRIYGGTLTGGNFKPVGFQFSIGLRVDSASDFIAQDLTVQDFLTDSIHIGGNDKSRDITISNCSLYRVGRNLLSIVNAAGVRVLSNRFIQTLGDNPGAGIDIEGNKSEQIENLSIIGNFISDCSIGIYDQKGLGEMGRKHYILDNTILKSRRLGMVLNSATSAVVADNLIDTAPTGVSFGAFKDSERAEVIATRNEIKNCQKGFLLAGVCNSQVVDNSYSGDFLQPGLGISGEMFFRGNRKV